MLLSNLSQITNIFFFYTRKSNKNNLFYLLRYSDITTCFEIFHCSCFRQKDMLPLWELKQFWFSVLFLLSYDHMLLFLKIIKSTKNSLMCASLCYASECIYILVLFMRHVIRMININIWRAIINFFLHDYFKKFAVTILLNIVYIINVILSKINAQFTYVTYIEKGFSLCRIINKGYGWSFVKEFFIRVYFVSRLICIRKSFVIHYK